GGEWGASAGQVLSQQLGQCLAQWLQARRLPPVGPLAVFTVDDLCSVAQRLAAADDLLAQSRDLGPGERSEPFRAAERLARPSREGDPMPSGLALPRSLSQPPARLPVPYLRVLAELSRDDARTLDAIVLGLEPGHVVAR